MPDAIRWYDQNVSDVSRRYESVAAESWWDQISALNHTTRLAQPTHQVFRLRFGSVIRSWPARVFGHGAEPPPGDASKR
jgi:hypothetical protein